MLILRFLSVIVTGLALSACADLTLTPLSQSPSTIPIPDVRFIEAGRAKLGTTVSERTYAYRLDQQAYGSTITQDQKWYEREIPAYDQDMSAFFMTTTPITNAQYAAFIKEKRHRFPHVDAIEWDSYKLIHPLKSTKKYAWRGILVPKGREDHPVVLVSHDDARAYARWLSQKTGQVWRLPRENEWEYAARGARKQTFPWGNGFNPDALNSADQGPKDTMPVGSFPAGASPFGVLDMAGQVYEWTDTPGELGRYTVKGGAWDDLGCGVCRVGARHHRAADMKHILIGFRLVRDYDNEFWLKN